MTKLNIELAQKYANIVNHKGYIWVDDNNYYVTSVVKSVTDRDVLDTRTGVIYFAEIQTKPQLPKPSASWLNRHE